MATVLHKTTGEYRASVNTPDYPASEWIINPTAQQIADAAAAKATADAAAAAAAAAAKTTAYVDAVAALMAAVEARDKKAAENALRAAFVALGQGA